MWGRIEPKVAHPERGENDRGMRGQDRKARRGGEKGRDMKTDQ